MRSAEDYGEMLGRAAHRIVLAAAAEKRAIFDIRDNDTIVVGAVDHELSDVFYLDDGEEFAGFGHMLKAALFIAQGYVIHEEQAHGPESEEE